MYSYITAAIADKHLAIRERASGPLVCDCVSAWVRSSARAALLPTSLYAHRSNSLDNNGGRVPYVQW